MRNRRPNKVDRRPNKVDGCNGTATKRVKGRDGAVPLAVPRGRNGSFAPELVREGQTLTCGVDDRIVGLHAAGLPVCDLRGHLEDLCRPKVLPHLISRGGAEMKTIR